MTWSQIMSSAASSLDYLRQLETAKSILNILKTNARAAHSLGHSYVFQVREILTNRSPKICTKWKLFSV